ncbi:MAG TPA: hypothetical protein PL131_10240 [Methylotenera sp.]|nr:hypothetical protein [Methylotenera sp.]HPH06244.1 hypothetical protein [Methylotenera sp.]HPN00956.1 hypothetical protein [Methylotenera sp.]
MARTSTANPYLFAVITAIFSAMLTLLGNYYAAKWQVNNSISERQFEHRVSAYNSFVESIASEKSPVLSQMFNLGNVLYYSNQTDIELQVIENQFEILVNNYYKSGQFWKLNSQFSVLTVHGSSTVKMYCEDITAVLMMRDDLVDWKKYNNKIQALHETFTQDNKNEDTYIDLKVNQKERLMMIMSSALYSAMIEQISLELQETES